MSRRTSIAAWICVVTAVILIGEGGQYAAARLSTAFMVLGAMGLGTFAVRCIFQALFATAFIAFVGALGLGGCLSLLSNKPRSRNLALAYCVLGILASMWLLHNILAQARGLEWPTMSFFLFRMAPVALVVLALICESVLLLATLSQKPTGNQASLKSLPPGSNVGRVAAVAGITAVFWICYRPVVPVLFGYFSVREIFVAAAMNIVGLVVFAGASLLLYLLLRLTPLLRDTTRREV